MDDLVIIKKEKKLNSFNYILLLFFIYAFIGWGLETLYAMYNFGHFVKRGFLYGPICPIYGYGAVILVLFMEKYKDSSFKLFVYSIVVFSVFEYIASFALDALFASKWWDYTNEFFNLNGRISIFYSFVWGIFAILFAHHVHPFIKKYVDKLLHNIPYYVIIVLLYLVTIVYIFDTVLSVIKYLV
jgi:uncharacterized membrane protein